MIRKFAAFAAVTIGLVVVAYGQEQSDFRCKLFSIDTDSSKMVVSQGQLGSGNAGDETRKTPSKPYIVQVTPQTNIHWQGTTDKMTLRDLQGLNLKQLNMPLIIRYNKADNQDGQTPTRFTASEVIVLKDDQRPKP